MSGKLGRDVGDEVATAVARHVVEHLDRCLADALLHHRDHARRDAQHGPAQHTKLRCW